MPTLTLTAWRRPSGGRTPRTASASNTDLQRTSSSWTCRPSTARQSSQTCTTTSTSSCLRTSVPTTSWTTCLPCCCPNWWRTAGCLCARCLTEEPCGRCLATHQTASGSGRSTESCRRRCGLPTTASKQFRCTWTPLVRKLRSHCATWTHVAAEEDNGFKLLERRSFESFPSPEFSADHPMRSFSNLYTCLAFEKGRRVGLMPWD